MRQRGQALFPRSHRYCMVKSGFEPSHLALASMLLMILLWIASCKHQNDSVRYGINVIILVLLRGKLRLRGVS